MPTSAPILDLYAPLNHKAPMSTGPGPKYQAKSWVPPEHRRRLIAYLLLEAYCRNNASQFRADDKERRGLREYGDPDTLVEAIQSALIGDSQVISVAGAEHFDEDSEDAEAQAIAERAREREQQLIQWAEDERLLIKIPGAERKAVRLGDAVYSLIWSPNKQRPILRTWDPGFYYPVFGDFDDDFPSKVHLAFEIDNPRDPNKTKVRRITFELRDIDPDAESVTGWPEGVVFNERAGMASMQLPWNDEDRPATKLCYMSDGIWTIDSAKGHLDDFDPNKAEWNTNEEDQVIRDLCLNIDFVPVIHIPNTEEDDEHFGMSALLRVAQLLDDLAMDDSDLAATAATSASPVTAFEGGEGPDVEDKDFVTNWGPGAFIHNPNGKISVLSTATALEPLSKLNDRLQQRLSVNARVPASAMGKIDPNGQESGIQLALSWGPLRSMISQLRLGRRDKYRLLLKFIQRYFQLAGQIEPGPEEILTADIVFGSFLPTDTDAEVRRIIELFKAKLLSRRTAINMLVELGVPIDDADEELRRIEQEDFEAAEALFAATGNSQAAAERLGVEVVEETPLPPVPEF